MKFMIIRKADKNTETGALPSADLGPAMTPESKEQFERLLPQGTPKK